MAQLAQTKPHPEWKRLLERYSDADFGTVLSHEDIERCIGVPYGTRRYYQQVRQWSRMMLRERHRAVRVLNKIGYEVVKPDDYTAHSRNRFLQGRRRLKESVRIAAVAPVDRMTPVQATKHADHLAWMAPILKVLSKIERNTRPGLLGMKRPDLPKLKE